MNEEITKKLEDAGYDYAIAVATQSEIENGAACGQLSIIIEDEKRFSYDEVYQIALDVMNLGMGLRQDQLRGFSNKSGTEVLSEYMKERFETDEKGL